MKTKIIISAIFVFIIALNTFSQEYHPLLNNSSWLIYDWVSCCRPPEERKIEEGTDEIIGSVTYKKFIDPFANSIYPAEVYLREDVIAKKVYKLVNGAEVLLYDFSLTNSNVISLDGNSFTATVDNIPVNVGTRKRITLKSSELYCGQQLTQIWIEGVGTDRHPFYPDFNIMNVCSGGGGYNIFTKCSFQNGVYVYGTSDCAPLSLNEASTESIQLFPNPAKDIVHVHLENSNEFLESITVYNLLGKVVYKVSNIAAGQSSVSVNSLAKGMYLMEITTKNKMNAIKKLIIQ